MITTASLPPPILQSFNPYLLDNAIRRKKRILDDRILPLSLKKIRPQDVGKQREFQKLLKEFEEVYGRKTIEKAEYDAKVKEAAQKRPSIPNSGATMRFKRYER